MATYTNNKMITVSKLTKPQQIYLLHKTNNLDSIKSIPRLFTISTKNNSCKFNTEILTNVSIVIENFIKKNPQTFEYHLDIEDKKNTIMKFEKIFQGELVKFTGEEFSFIREFKQKLSLYNFPDFVRNSFYGTKMYSNGIRFVANGSSIKIDESSLYNFYQSNSNQTFIIETKKNQYKCNIFGVFFSAVIREAIYENPKTDCYLYDYEDNGNEFQYICDIFNFKFVDLTNRNIDSIKEIAEDLKIDSIYVLIDNFLNFNEEMTQRIDDQQNLIDSIDNLSDLLYNIKEKTVDFVSDLIKESQWSQSEGAVYELAAYILQAALSNIHLHEYLVDLLIKINECEKDEKNCNLNLLTKIVIKQSMNKFFEKIEDSSGFHLIFPFIYQMYKKQVIQKDEFDSILKKCHLKNSFFISWFLPELIELNPNMVKNSFYSSNIIVNQNGRNKFELYYPCESTKMDQYKSMRDRCANDNEIAKALRNDDIDTFQSIVSTNVNKLLKETICENMFEDFIIGQIRYLNYAAAYGSIKCFKYMLLNEELIDDSTLRMAIIGGNNEIIRIVDNKKVDFTSSRPRKTSWYNPEIDFQENILQVIMKTIELNRNDLFDWIFEQKFESIKQDENLYCLFRYSVKNGNMHTLVHVIDNGYNLSNFSNKDYSNLLNVACERGFYTIAVFLNNLFGKKVKIDPRITVNFGSISIFKLFENSMTEENFKNAFNFAIKQNHTNIIEYFFDHIVNKKFKFNSVNSIEILSKCFSNDLTHILNYMIDKINIACPFNIFALNTLITNTKKTPNCDAYKKIAELVYEKEPESDFTLLLIYFFKTDLKEMIVFFINKNYQINYEDVINSIVGNSTLDIDIFAQIANKISPESRKRLNMFIDRAIIELQKPLLQFLLKESQPLENSLIEAVKTNDITIVDMILEKRSDPLFINKNSENGTALSIAVQKENVKIVSKLLSIPGIDPNIYTYKYSTPLILTAFKLRDDIFKLIFNFYGNEIVKEKWQLEKIVKIIIDDINFSAVKKKKKKNKESDCTSLLNKYKILISIIRLNCIDPNMRLATNTILSYACQNDFIDIVQLLLQNEKTDVNIRVYQTGDTPLITAIKCNSKATASSLLQHPKINVNIKNYEGFSPLMLASKNNMKNIVEGILKNKNFDPIESNINLSFYFSNNETSKLFLPFESLDVNFVPSYNYDTFDIEDNEIIKYPLIKAILNRNSELFDLIVQHPSFKKDEKQIFDAIFISIYEKNANLFKKSFQLLDENRFDINSHIFNNESILIQVMRNDPNKEMISLILNYPKFDSKKSDIIKAFNLSYSNFKKNEIRKKDRVFIHKIVEIINLIYNFDDTHDHLIDSEIEKEGSSFLSNIYDTFYYERGIDPNLRNNMINNTYPLEQSIIDDSYILSLCLINTNLINFDTKIQNGYSKSIKNKNFGNLGLHSTYLHLAASLGRCKLIKTLLNKKLIDINIKNNYGDTPLMDACRNNQIECIEILFKYDDLDFLHRNKDGEDAIDIVKSMKLPKSRILYGKKVTQEKTEIKNKDEYLAELLKLINQKQQQKEQEDTRSNNDKMSFSNKVKDIKKIFYDYKNVNSNSEANKNAFVTKKENSGFGDKNVRSFNKNNQDFSFASSKKKSIADSFMEKNQSKSKEARIVNAFKKYAINTVDDKTSNVNENQTTVISKADQTEIKQLDSIESEISNNQLTAANQTDEKQQKFTEISRSAQNKSVSSNKEDEKQQKSNEISSNTENQSSASNKEDDKQQKSEISDNTENKSSASNKEDEKQQKSEISDNTENQDAKTNKKHHSELFESNSSNSQAIESNATDEKHKKFNENEISNKTENQSNKSAFNYSVSKNSNSKEAKSNEADQTELNKIETQISANQLITSNDQISSELENLHFNEEQNKKDFIQPTFSISSTNSIKGASNEIQTNQVISSHQKEPYSKTQISSSNLLDTSVQNSPMTDFNTHTESFSEKPDPNMQLLLRNLNKKMRNHSKLKRKKNSHSKFESNEDDANSQYLEYEQQFYDQFNFGYLQQQQQQQQWMQMIQMNNDLQARINLQMMNQAQMNLIKSKNKNKKVKL